METWEQPRITEVCMNAEIGSYQEDYDPRESPIVEPAHRDASPSTRHA
jgi:hypothetical protein